MKINAIYKMKNISKNVAWIFKYMSNYLQMKTGSKK